MGRAKGLRVSDGLYTGIFREALRVATAVGTWVLHRARDTRNIEHLIGYLVGRIGDFEARRKPIESPDRNKWLMGRQSRYRRAIRWLQSIRGGDHQALATRVLADIGRDPAYAELPFVAAGEAHQTRNARDEPRRAKLSAVAKPRRRGRPASIPQSSVPYRACDECQGRGFFPR
jgi:hypothetical protein